eukprot:6321857-Pyramimonas_sp.AAC.1
MHHWNILADNVAKDVARDRVPSMLLSSRLLSMATYHEGGEWEWARQPFDHSCLGMPCLDQGQMSYLSTPQLASNEDCPKQPEPTQARYQVELRAT